MTQDESTTAKSALAGSEGGIVNPGGERGEREPGKLVPPYDERQSGGPGQTGPGYGTTEGHLAFNAEQSDAGYAGREVSDEERGGVHPADPEPESVHGVGESRDTAYGDGDFTDLGTKGPTERPVGGSTPEQSTGVDAQDNRDPDSPEMPAGDQGG